jgi:hypothetical protein
MSLVQRNRRRAKAVERVLAKRLGGRRVGILGQEDIFTDLFSVEVKARKAVAVWDWYQQAVRNAKGKVPLLIIHVTGKRHDEDLVVMSLADFERLIKREGR